MRLVFLIILVVILIWSAFAWRNITNLDPTDQILTSDDITKIYLDFDSREVPRGKTVEYREAIGRFDLNNRVLIESFKCFADCTDGQWGIYYRDISNAVECDQVKGVNVYLENQIYLGCQPIEF